MKKSIIVIVLLIIYIFTIGRYLLPDTYKMFDFHDGTVPLRIAEFAYNLKALKIPPRMAPHFSFSLTYPVFNFYAPFAFWIGSLIYLTGIGIVATLKLLFLLPLIIAFIGMFLFVNVLFGFTPAILAAILYSTSPWLAVELFIRGNIGELWIIALLPLSLYFLIQNSRTNVNKINFVITVIILHFLFTSHNIFSIFSLGIVIIMSLLLSNRKRNIVAVIIALLSASYFYIPLFLENHLVNSTVTILMTNYKDHFLCAWQLWTTNHWGYGGSMHGCEIDAMPFMVGKWQILAGVVGFAVLVVKRVTNKTDMSNRINCTNIKILTFFALVGVVSFFLTLFISRPVWDLFQSILALVQFPWRFNLFIVFSLSVCAVIPLLFIRWRHIIIPVLIFSVFLMQNNIKFFQKYEHDRSTFFQKYYSEKVLFDDVVFSIPDYFPKVGDFDHWLTYRTEWDITKKPNYILAQKPFISFERNKNINVLENTTYYRKGISEAKRILVNIHYYPYWDIRINGQSFIPKEFDTFARPIIQTNAPFTIELEYRQTLAQKAGNTVTILTMLGLLFYLAKRDPERDPEINSG